MADNDNITNETRQRIWAELRQVALPDSRFHWDFSSFIPNFVDNDCCTEQVLGLDAYNNLQRQRVFITPDNSTEDLRYQLLKQQQPFVITTYGIVRGFLQLNPNTIPKGEERYAATLDGADYYGQPISMAELRDGPVFGLLITGSAAVSSNGVRFGKGHGYFDLEWAMLSELGLIDVNTTVVAVVHDCQVVAEPLPAKPHDVVVDLIVTPSRLIKVDTVQRPLGTLRWEELRSGELAQLSVIDELRELFNIKI